MLNLEHRTVNIEHRTQPALLLVDGHNLAYRAYHAIAPMRTTAGISTHALFGFIRTLEHLPRVLSASHLAVVFDGGMPPERRALLAAYKAHRPAMPEDLRLQFPLIEEYLDAAGIRRVRMPEQEADDLMATLARRAEGEVQRVYIASTDRDMMQVVDSVIRLVEPTKRALITDADGVRVKTGVSPGQVLAWRALVGDPSDNIPGVPGIGPKTAARLLNEYGSLAAIWATVDHIEPIRIRKVLLEHRELVERNMKLMRLDDGAACPLDWKDCVKGREDAPAMTELYRRVEFNSMLNERREPRLFE